MNTTTKQAAEAISGNTYPVKDQLKAMGARWNADAKCWMISADKADEARRIVEGAGPKKAYTGVRRSSGFSSRGGARNGCYMGCREGNPNPRCKSCMFDEFDN